MILLTSVMLILSVARESLSTSFKKSPALAESIVEFFANSSNFPEISSLDSLGGLGDEGGGEEEEVEVTSFVVVVDEVESEVIELVVVWGNAVEENVDFACCYPFGDLCETMTVFNSFR